MSYGKVEWNNCLFSGNAERKWNGLAVAAFARAGQILEQPRYLTAASRGVNFWESRLTDAEGRLLARWRDGEAAYPAGHSFSLLSFLEELWPAGELVCSSKEIQPEIFPFLREYPDLAVLYKTAENAERLSEIAPFTTLYPVPESGARYWFCRNRRCEQPVDSLEELRCLLIR